jgi:hypothetical protein
MNVTLRKKLLGIIGKRGYQLDQSRACEPISACNLKVRRHNGYDMVKDKKTVIKMIFQPVIVIFIVENI